MSNSTLEKIGAVIFYSFFTALLLLVLLKGDLS